MLFVHVTIVMLNVWFLFICLFIPFFSVVLFRNVSENSNKGFSQETHCYHPDLDNDTSSVWNFCARSSDVISRGNQWWSHEYRLSSQANFLMEDILSFGNQ